MTEASVIVHKVNIQEIEDDRYTLPPYSCFFLVYLKIFPECFFLMDLASLVAVSVVTVACSMLSLLLVNNKHGVCNPTKPEF